MNNQYIAEIARTIRESADIIERMVATTQSEDSDKEGPTEPEPQESKPTLTKQSGPFGGKTFEELPTAEELFEPHLRTAAKHAGVSYGLRTGFISLKEFEDGWHYFRFTANRPPWSGGAFNNNWRYRFQIDYPQAGSGNVQLGFASQHSGRHTKTEVVILDPKGNKVAGGASRSSASVYLGPAPRIEDLRGNDLGTAGGWTRLNPQGEYVCGFFLEGNKNWHGFRTKSFPPIMKRYPGYAGF